jgi:calcium permeable stress-gated cation channel
MSSESDNLGSALDSSSGSGQRSQGMSLKTFLASLVTALAIFGIEILLFLLLKSKLTRI